MSIYKKTFYTLLEYTRYLGWFFGGRCQIIKNEFLFFFIVLFGENYLKFLLIIYTNVKRKKEKKRKGCHISGNKIKMQNYINRERKNL